MTYVLPLSQTCHFQATLILFFLRLHTVARFPFFFKSNYMSMNILNKIVNQKIKKLVPDELLLNKPFDLSVCGDYNSTNKRKLDEFLTDYYGSSSKGMGGSQKITEIEDDEEEEPLQDLATIQALNEIDFILDAKYRKVLKAHQFKGLQFMWDRVYKKKQGCLLAHSMGLGKTIQTVALLTTMYQYLKRYPSTKFPTVIHFL